MSNELLKRHGGHHHASNVVGGNFILLFSLVYLVLLAVHRFLVSRFHTYSQFVPKFLQKIYKIQTVWLISIWVLLLNLFIFRNLIRGKVKKFDIEFLTDISKKFARYSYALFPLVIFIALRPIPLVSSNNYLTMLPIHKWLSRLLVLMFTIHGTIYFYEWILEGKVWHHIFVEIVNLYGIIALVLFLIVIITSIRYVRRKNYNLFYLIHTTTVWISFPLITLHARPGVLLITCICLILMTYMVIRRVISTYKISDLEIITPDFSTLTMVRMPSNIILNQNIENPLDVFLPGSHIRISQPLNYFKAWFNASHPFSIASLSTDESLDLIIKNQSFTFDPLKHYSMSFTNNPINKDFFDLFDSSKTLQNNPTSDASGKDVIIVVGGSGISFGLPIFRYLAQFSKQNQNRIKLVWITRNKYDLYILEKSNIIHPYDDLNNLQIKDEYKGLVDIYLTNGAGSKESSSSQKIMKGRNFFTKFISLFSRSVIDSRYHQVNGEDVNEFELESISSSGNSNGEDQNSNIDVDDLSTPDTDLSNKSTFVRQGRPHLPTLLNDYLFSDEDFGYFEENDDNDSEPTISRTKKTSTTLSENNKFVISCGPSSLVDNCLSWCKHNDVSIIDEYYEM